MLYHLRNLVIAYVGVEALASPDTIKKQIQGIGERVRRILSGRFEGMSSSQRTWLGERSEKVKDLIRKAALKYNVKHMAICMRERGLVLVSKDWLKIHEADRLQLEILIEE